MRPKPANPIFSHLLLPVSRHGMRSYGHATACPRARRGVPVRFGCSRRFIPCSYGSKSSSIPSGVAHAVLAFVSGASWGNGVSPALVRSADARVLGVRLRLFYNGRRVAPSPLGGIGPVVLCHLPRASMLRERIQAGRDGRDTATPGCAGKRHRRVPVQETPHRQECLCHKSSHQCREGGVQSKVPG